MKLMGLLEEANKVFFILFNNGVVFLLLAIYPNMATNNFIQYLFLSFFSLNLRREQFIFGLQQLSFKNFNYRLVLFFGLLQLQIYVFEFVG